MMKIGNLNINSFKLGTSDVSIYLGNVKLYPTSTAQTPCYDVIDGSISSYSGTFLDVYSTSADKWYKRNNLNEYEEYGVYGEGRNITYYQGKLTIDDGVEYIYSGNSWVSVGETSGGTIDTIWFDPANTNAEFAIGHYWGEGYKMVWNCYLNGSFSSDSGSFWRSQNQTPIEFSFYANGFYLDMHYPTSTSEPSVYTGDYSYRIMKNGTLNNYVSSQVMNITVENGNVKANLESTGALITSGSSSFSSQSWYNGLYQAKINLTDSSRKKSHLSSIKVYNGNNELVNDLKFVKNRGVTGSQEISIYDAVLDVKYDNTNEYTPTYHIVSTSGGVEYPLYYTEKQDPPQNLTFSSMTEALDYECPYVGLYATIDGDLYVFNSNYQWEQVSYTITGLTKSSSDFTIKLNGVDETCTVYSDNGDGTYNWGIAYLSAITSVSAKNNINLVSLDFGEANTSGMTSIGNSAFNGCSSLSSITIPNSVTTIGNAAFIGCTSLSSITIPNSVTTIGYQGFQACSNLTSITIPNSVTTLGESSFPNCTRLLDVTLSSGISNIPAFAFSNCTSLSSITIPNGVTSIGQYAFRKCSSLSSITIPSGVTSINNGAFEDCSALTSIDIPSGVTSINSSTFSGCSKLTSIAIPNSVTSIGGSAFQNCSRLSSITIPSGVTSIGSSAFYNSGLKSVSFSHNTSALTSIGSYAFYRCGLSSVEIPKGVTTIGNNVFEQNVKLGSAIIPSTVTNLGIGVFSGCSSMTEATFALTSTLTTIPNSTFRYCFSLRSVTLPSGITNIGDYAFYQARSLSSITLPNSVTRIGNYGFYNCSGLTGTFTIPSGVTSIGNSAFCYCNSVTSMTSYAATPPTLGSNAFSGTSYPIYVPCISLSDYQSASNWSSYSSRLQSIPNCTSEWRIVSGEYVCDNGDKYALEEGFITYDSGTTWIDLGITRTGSLIESGSTDCQYVVPSDYDELEYIAVPRQSALYGNNAFTIPFEMNALYDYEFVFTPSSWGSDSTLRMVLGAVQYGEKLQIRTDNKAISVSNSGTTIVFYNYDFSNGSGKGLYNQYRLYDNEKTTVKFHLNNYSTGNGATMILEYDNVNHPTLTLSSSYIRNSSAVITDGVFDYYMFSNPSNDASYKTVAPFYFYNLKCSENSTPKYDYRTVKRKSDNKLGFFDVVNQQFFYSDSLTFNAGPIKS